MFRLTPVAAAIAVFVGLHPTSAAATSCVYDAGAGTVTATIPAGGEATLEVRPSGELWFGAVPAACGSATTTNTNLVQVAGTAGTTERLTLDQSEGFLGPGAASEANLPEVELAVGLGDAADEVVVLGTSGDDAIAMGASGLSLNSDGDVDVTFSPLPAHVEIQGLDGVNFLTGRGGFGAGLAFAGTLVLTGGSLDDELNGGNGRDLLTGGGGNDVLNGNAGDDEVEGGVGGDRLSGGEGGDDLDGGPGPDTFLGGFGSDLLMAHDGEADVSINGGADADIAFYDPGLDPAPSAVETKIGAPPTESCEYDAVAKTVNARVELGSEATLKVTATGELRFGFAPSSCGGATTANTDSITVSGTAGATERLVLDLSDGFLGPGAATEANFPEVELAVGLGDAADELVVLGTGGNDTIAMGASGLSLNSDGDLDVTFSPLPATVEIEDEGGVNFLTGRGGFGAGLAYAGALTLRGGDLGDELNGGNGPDLIVGGNGNDLVNGSGGADDIRGNAGNDRLVGSDGGDAIVGGPGADDLVGGNGDDLLDADDGEGDTQIHGGQGVDTAYYDAGVDPGLTSIENPLADPGEEPPPPPPPPPAGACEYRAGTKEVVASMPTAGEATLAAVGGGITFGAAPSACGAATTANTDGVVVLGVAGTGERLTLDLSSGILAPGAATEANTPEIEVVAQLGDPADELVVVGTDGNDTFVAGASGVSLNGDGDVDVTFDVLPGRIAFEGRGGVNVLTGRGGAGAGLAYGGALTLVAGDLGDELSGGNGDDVVVGGAGNDVIFGNPGNDRIAGGAGDDQITGSDGNDTVVGGAGADSLSGGYGDDVLDADDDAVDAQIHGGPGTDTAYYDAGVDPATIAVENPIPR